MTSTLFLPIRGTRRREIVPLAELERRDPAAFEQAERGLGAGADERALAQRNVPGLECRWRDLVFLTPIHPHALWDAWREISGVSLPSRQFEVVSTAGISAPTAIFRPQHTPDGAADLDARDVSVVSADSIGTLFDLPPELRTELEGAFAAGAVSPRMPSAPVVLVRGTVTIDDGSSAGPGEVVDWNDAWAHRDARYAL